MLRSVIEAGEHRSCLLRDNGRFVILSRKLADGIQRVEQHHGNELDLIPDIPAKQLNALEAANVTILNADEDFFLEQGFILIGIAGRRPPMPDSAYHCRHLSSPQNKAAGS
jgi:hypothetical protein